MIPEEDKTPIYYLRRGTLYGAALGLLLGLASVAAEGFAEQAAIVAWRNWIVGGAVVGLLAGAIKAVQVKLATNEERDI